MNPLYFSGIKVSHDESGQSSLSTDVWGTVMAWRGGGEDKGKGEGQVEKWNLETWGSLGLEEEDAEED